MPVTLKRRVRAVAHRLGYDVIALRSDFAEQQARLLGSLAVDLVVDVGANEGQYVQKIRALGYAGAVRSYEPGSAAFRRLSAAASKDDLWTVANVAVGDHVGTAVLNVSGNSVSSSLLQMDNSHLHAAPESAYSSTEEVTIVTLDSEMPAFGAATKIWLKIDTQGAEDVVLAGADEVLRRAVAVQCELSMTPLYRGGPDWLTVVRSLQLANFRLAGVEPGLQDSSGQELLQMDGLFLRDA